MAKPKTALGRYLEKRKDKKVDKAVVSPERVRLLSDVEDLRERAGMLGLPGMQLLLENGLDLVVSRESALDNLPDAASRRAPLAQLGTVVLGLRGRLETAESAAGDLRVLNTAVKRQRLALAAVKDLVEASRIEAKLLGIEQETAATVTSTDARELDGLRSQLQSVQALRSEIDHARLLDQIEAARLKVEADLPALRRRAVTARALDNSSPAMKALRLTMGELEMELDSATRQGEHREAMAYLPRLAAAIGDVEGLEIREAKAYADGLKIARERHAALTHAVVKNEAALFEAEYVTEAVRLASAGDRDAAVARLQPARAEGRRLAALMKEYTDKLAAARLALDNTRAKMLSLDIDKVEKDMIGAAETRATAGERLAALALLAGVKRHCAVSERANLKAFLAQGQWDAEMLSNPVKTLSEHAAKAAFATEIAALQARLDGLRKIVAANMTTRKAKSGAPTEKEDSFADKEILNIYFAATRQQEFADSHVLYLGARKTREDAIKLLKESAPTASNTAMVDEFKALQDALDKSARQAAKRTYDLAMETLARLAEATDAATTRKAAHASWVTELGLLEPRVANAIDVSGSPSAAEAEALRALLARARALAEKRDFAGANELLLRLRADCDAADRMEKARDADDQASTLALTSLEDDPATALAEVRKLLEALKQRPGHEGIARQMEAIDTLLGKADTALTA